LETEEDNTNNVEGGFVKELRVAQYVSGLMQELGESWSY
jgi:hypothetical protein